jgi:two-component system nitrogen regulation response regulator GlnG
MVQKFDTSENLLQNSKKPLVVLLLTDGTGYSTDLELIRTLRSKSVCLVCLSDRDSEDDLGSYCQILLAGGTHVLNVRSPDCIAQLCRLVEQEAKNALASHAEEECLSSIMMEAGFAGQSSNVLSLFRSVLAVSLIPDLPVLITGETGTGKELVAQSIHSLDPKRKRQQMVSINCAALPEELSESELFGHQRGAFTGAERERAGLFRSADGGMLFLDEVGELSLNLQAKLLRVLQTHHLRSVGADREMTVSVRVIAATNRPLEQMVREKLFREDLLHRLNVLSLHIPPLRERPGDIEPLIKHFVKKRRSVWEGKAGQPEVGRDFIQALRTAELPGNVRQLENLVCRALVNWKGNEPLSLKDLPPEMWRELSATEQVEAASAKSPSAHRTDTQAGFATYAMEYLRSHQWNLLETIRDMESILVQGAVTASRGNQSEAARLLGITPRSVYNKLHRTELR